MAAKDFLLELEGQQRRANVSQSKFTRNLQLNVNVNQPKPKAANKLCKTGDHHVGN